MVMTDDATSEDDTTEKKTECTCALPHSRAEAGPLRHNTGRTGPSERQPTTSLDSSAGSGADVAVA